MTKSSLFVFLSLMCLITPRSGAEEDLLVVSGPMTPRVAYGLERTKDALILTIDAAGFKPGDTDVTAGISADKTVRLSAKEAVRTKGKEGERFVFKVPSKNLVTNPEGWKKLRLGFAVEWAGGVNGQARLKQRFLHSVPGAAHAGLSANPTDWQAFDLNEWEKQEEDRRQKIHFAFEQPMEGKATIVIEDSAGRRVRNLILGQFEEKGDRRIEWDGLDEVGNVVQPGKYRWRAISHPGLEPVYLMSFVDGPGSNHGTLHAATNNGKRIVLGTPVSEGGHQVALLEKDGTFVRGYNAPHGIGLGRIQLAADDQTIYAAYDGSSWGNKVDKTAPNWKNAMHISLVRFGMESGETIDFSKKERIVEVSNYEVGPGSTGARPDRLALRGLVLLGGKLYLADGFNNDVKVIDPATGATQRTFPLADPVALATGNGSLYAILGGNHLVKVDPETGKSTEIAELKGQPAGLAVGPDNRFYVSDTEAQVVKVLDEKGREVSVIGKPGGIAPGPYDPLKFKNPEGLTVLDGLVWVTENGRWQPKRFAAFDVKTGQVAFQSYGPTNYGAQGAGFDPEDQTRWIGQGTLFQLDFDKKNAKPLSILGGETGRRHTFWRQDGRTFIITSGKATYIQELTKEGLLRPLAMFSSAHQYAYSENWTPPQVFVDAFTKAYPQVQVTVGKKGGIQRIQPNHGYGMLWVDKNGDTQMQADEIEFSTAAENLGGSGWSHDFHDLTLKLPGTVAGKKVLVSLKPEGWWPGGAPKYPALNDAVKAGVSIQLPGSNQVETAIDRFGDMVTNTDPMMAFSPKGEMLWSYPNHWIGVHGSHDAPLPSTGEMQGALFFSGMVPLDDKSDVMLLNGNHGRAFVMTSDGLYLDEMFPDVRMMNNPQAGGIGILGGECFGGTFGKSEKDGNYYFQGGGISYRIYRIDGLKEIKRSAGEVEISALQAAAAERAKNRNIAENTESKSATIATLTQPPTIDGSDAEWKEIPETKWDNNGKFPVKVKAGYDAQSLYLYYTVKDDSPWVNQGKDWQSLFKTGDGIDLQLGTDITANPKRGGAVPGDLRLFIAPSANGNTAVLYKHRVPGSKDGDGVVFQSPWRSEKVDVVKKLDSAKVAVKSGNGEYRVEVAVPLAELGIKSLAGLNLSGDFGAIYGDTEGTTNIFRNYWSNKATGLVNDVPGEIMLTPSLWGAFSFEEAK